MGDETTKYQTEWQDFQDRSAKGCIAGIVVLLVVAASGILGRYYPEAGGYIAIVFLMGALGALIFPSFDWWRCPRCKANFDYYKPRQVRYCVNCGLPKFYGSSFYFDLWGTAEGVEMAERIKDGKL